MCMGVRTLGMPELPYQWTDDELPHQLDCHVSARGMWACMSELTKNVWVPKGWVEDVESNWDRLESYVRQRQRYHGAPGVREPLPADKELDHWTIRDLLKQDGVCWNVRWHNGRVEYLVRQIACKRKKPNVVKITPEQWLEIRGKLRQFSYWPEHWSDGVEQEKYEELMTFLTAGDMPEEYHVGEKHLPKLRPDQAAAVLWFLNCVTGLDINDIRYQPCSRCGEMHTAGGNGGDWSCEGCGVHVCDDCGNYIGVSSSVEDEPWWPDGYDSDGYCEKCVGLIEKHCTAEAVE